MIADTRARVPFALLGVLLLVSSLALAPTLSPDPVPTDTAVERALDRVTAETQTAVRDGTAVAGRRAAASPVVTPANTTAGRVLNESSPYRDALRLRVYAQVRQRLTQVAYGTDGIRAEASLPRPTGEDGLRAAKRRVAVERAGPNGTATSATVRNVTLTVSRDGRVVTERTVSPTVVVATPTLALHDRTTAYETRLNNGLSEPGLSRRLTARLYPIAWTRGYAQYSGAPIDNVVANRHVSLATNGALLGVQRQTFGRSDPDGRQALTEATAATGVEDIVRASGPQPASDVLDRTSYRPVEREIDTVDGGERPRPNETMRVGVNETADAAFRSVVAPDRFQEIVESVYTVDVRLVTETSKIGGGTPSKPPSPGSNWTLVRDRTSRTAETTGAATGTVSTPDGWHRLDSFGRVVEFDYTRTAVWENGSERTTTVTRRSARHRVLVSVAGQHDGSPAPDRPISTAHDRGAGPLDGPNLAGVEDRTERQLLDRRGGRDAVARRAAVGEVDTEPVAVETSRPDGLREWMYRDLLALRERVRNVTVTAERGAIGSFEANPSAELRERLSGQRRRLEDIPPKYGSTTEKARTAVRIAYLDAVEGRLAARSNGRTRTRDAVGAELSEQTGGSLRDLRRGLAARDTKVPRARPIEKGPAGPVRTRVDARPQYLTLAELNEDRHPAIDGSEHPLVARNVNVFTVPYGDAASAATEGVAASADRARLSTAAATLEAANTTLENASNGTLERKRDRLRASVAEANGRVERRLAEALARETGLGRADSRATVTAATATYQTTAARGQALANGSATERIAAEAARCRGLSRVERDWLRIQLTGTANDALEGPVVRPRSERVDAVASATRQVAKDRLSGALATAGERASRRIAARRFGTSELPAGLPVAPPLGPWYATTNVWWVSVEGEYARFAVSAAHGPPSELGGTTTYARDGSAVRADVDGDGEREHLGNATRVSFAAETGVVVVVPPRPRGVGDKGGNADEQSSGWPSAG